MKRLLSYIWPITQYFNSSKNGKVEVTWLDGKKVLDTKNANFSYGSLQKILKHGLTKIKIDLDDDILLLGLGAGSVVETLRKDFNHNGVIKAIEIDEIIIEIAEKEFKLAKWNDLEVICADAFEYIKNIEETYDIIIVDLFIDRNLPHQCYSNEFWRQLFKMLNKGGYIVFNAGFYQLDNEKLNHTFKSLKTELKFSKYEKIQGNSTLYIAEKL